MSAVKRIIDVLVFAGCLCAAWEKPAVADLPTAPAAARPSCDLVGTYRLLYRSNGVDGWWLRLQVKRAHPSGHSVEVLSDSEMLGLTAGSLQLVAHTGACTLLLTAETRQAGDIRIALTLSPQTNAVSGSLTRSKVRSENDSPSPIAGVRDAGRAPSPSCLHPGIFALHTDKAKWRVTQGHPFPGDDCKYFTSMARALIRIEPLGDAVIIDGAEELPRSATEPRGRYKQGFSRGDVTRLSECEIALKLAVDDFKFRAKLTFAGDQVAGVAATAEFQIFNDGEAGENLWKCGAKNVAITGTRIAD